MFSIAHFAQKWIKSLTNAFKNLWTWCFKFMLPFNYMPAGLGITVLSQHYGWCCKKIDYWLSLNNPMVVWLLSLTFTYYYGQHSQNNFCFYMSICLCVISTCWRINKSKSYLDFTVLKLFKSIRCDQLDQLDELDIYIYI